MSHTSCQPIIFLFPPPKNSGHKQHCNPLVTMIGEEPQAKTCLSHNYLAK